MESLNFVEVKSRGKQKCGNVLKMQVVTSKARNQRRKREKEGAFSLSINVH